MTVSMTGFAARRGTGVGYDWAWDIRSVNGKGLDLRLRVPDWVDGLELASTVSTAESYFMGDEKSNLRIAVLDFI